MVGGEREGSVNVNGNGAPAGAVGAMHQPAPAPVVATAAANGGSGGGGAVAGTGGGLVVEKVKFTVSVRGHQWSSARHVNETLEEFAAAIQRNARRLDFIDEDDSIVRLQLAYNDGSEPEDLDVDATLGDVIICMGDKQLVAIVNSTKPAPSAAANISNGPTTTTTTTRPDSESNPCMGNASVGKRNVTAPSSYTTNTTTSNGPDLIAPDAAHKFTFPPYKSVCRASMPKNPVSTTDPSRALKINIPPDSPSLPFQEVDRSFHPDYILGSSLPPLPRPNGKVAMCGGAGKPAGGPSSVQQQFSSSNHQNPTPSPAELANMLVRSSSHPHRMQCGSYGPGVSAHTNSNRSSSTPPPTGGFQSFASALLSRLPMLPNQNIQCPHGATTNIALLAQFLASQLRAFVPPERTAAGAAHPSPACRETKLPKDENASNGGQAAPTNNAHAEKQNHADYALFANGSPKHPEAANAKLSVSGSHEKDESSSSANVNNTMAPSSGEGVDSEHPNGRSELVFLVNRRSKTRPQGVGTHHLKMSDLSTYFHLSVVDAAKKLGVSQTTLKKACRKFGLKRWPGRKVRSLESTIHGLEHTIAVGQGAGLEELTEAYMRSEVSKLQQEMDQLVHGTPAQHSPAVRTADLYKRLYSRGWRSKYHSPGRHDMINLNTGNHTNRTSGLAPPTARKNSKAAKEYIQQPKGSQKLTPCKEEEEVVAPNQPPENASKESSRPNSRSGSRLGSRPNSRSGSRDVEMTDYDIEGLLPEVHNINVDESSEVPVSDVQEENGNNLCSPKTTTTTTSLENNVKPSEDANDLAVEEVAAFAERSPKRRKRECRIAAETGAVRQGLRSSTCAM